MSEAGEMVRQSIMARVQKPSMDCCMCDQDVPVHQLDWELLETRKEIAHAGLCGMNRRAYHDKLPYRGC